MSQNKKWDWRVIALELLIVFVGLFAALQLDSYRDGRSFAQAQQRYLLRLGEDIAGYLDTMGPRLAFLEQNRVAVQHVADSLQANELLGGETELFERGLIYVGHLPTSPLPRGAYDEMVASGMFAALESEPLKQAVSELYALSEFASANFAWWRNPVLDLEQELIGHVEYYTEPGEVNQDAFVSQEPRRRVRYDFDSLAGNLRIQNGFYWAADVSGDWQSASLALADRARSVEAEIQRALDGQP
jgi:hypothetical protein